MKDSKKARNKFFQKHKSEIDSALTLVQSVLRGHRARQELQEGMEALRRAAPLTTARSAPTAADQNVFGVQRSPTRSRKDGGVGGNGPPPPPARTLPGNTGSRNGNSTDILMGNSVGSTTAPHLRGSSSSGSAPMPVPIAAKQPPRYIPTPAPAAAPLPETSVSAGTRYSDEESNSERSPTPTQNKGRGKTPLSRPTSASSFASSFVSEDLTSDASDSEDSDDDF